MDRLDVLTLFVCFIIGLGVVTFVGLVALIVTELVGFLS